MTAIKKQILVIEDEPTCQIILMQALVPKYQVALASTLTRAKEFMGRQKPDLILLDLYLPDGNGFEMIQFLKANDEWSEIPIMLLTSESDIQVKVRSFAEGVYDFVTKPFNTVELSARISAHLGRATELNSAHEKHKKVGDLTLDNAGQKITLHDGDTDTALKLSPLEFKILRYLMNHCGKVRTREQLAQSIWKRKYFQTRTIDRHISSIRKKLGVYANRLQTVSHGGYMLDVDLNETEQSNQNEGWAA